MLENRIHFEKLAYDLKTRDTKNAAKYEFIEWIS